MFKTLDSYIKDEMNNPEFVLEYEAATERRDSAIALGKTQEP